MIPQTCLQVYDDTIHRKKVSQIARSSGSFGNEFIKIELRYITNKEHKKCFKIMTTQNDIELDISSARQGDNNSEELVIKLHESKCQNQ